MLIILFGSRSCSCYDQQQQQQDRPPTLLLPSRRSLITRCLVTVSQFLFHNNINNINNNLCFAMSSSSTAATNNHKIRIIDTHLHVWANTHEAATTYPYQSLPPPPSTIVDRATPDSLLSQMSNCGVEGALIVQPINHKFDHSYVAAAIRTYPNKFKGMLLFDPSSSQSKADALRQLHDLLLQGFVGVRFNPSLWPTNLFKNLLPHLLL